MKRARKLNGILPQKMTAILLSAVLTAGLISNAMPVDVLAQENIGIEDAGVSDPVEGDGISGNAVSGGAASEPETPQDVTYAAGAAYVAEDSLQTRTAEASYSTDGGQTWVDVDEFINVFFSAYMTKDNTILRLNTDIILSQSIIPVMSGRHTTIDGQGHTISRGSCGGQLFTIGEPGHVTFKNVTIDGGAVWDNADNVQGRRNSGFSGGGSQNMIYICNEDASVTLDEGAILQNNSLDQSKFNGAAVMIEDGTFIMNDGAVIRNNSAVGTTEEWGGGGAAVGVNYSGCTFIMNGGEIYGNYASRAGGAVCNFGTFNFNGGKIYKNASGNHGGAVVNDSGTMIMAGGEITQNVSVTGGGISGKNDSLLSVKGGIIHHNTASDIAGGIYADGRTDLSGIPQIKDNTANGDTDNLYLAEGKTVTISDALTEGAAIGVTTAAAPLAETPVKITGTNGNDYSKYFNSDNENYKIENEESNVIRLVVKEGGDDKDKGTVSTDVKNGENAPAVGISTSEKELEDMLLTDSEKQQVEKGTDIKIILHVQDAKDTVSVSERSAVEAELNDYSMGQYLDISLYKLVGEHRSDITETEKKITITIAVPDSLKNTDSKKTRTFAVIRVHDGKAELLNDLDNSEDTITIETDRFSTYALVYKDVADGGAGSDHGNNGNDDNGNNNGGSSSTDNNNNSNNNNSNSGNTPDTNGNGVGNGNVSKNNGTKADASKDNEPKTGDVTPIELYATLSMIAGFSYLLLYFGDCRRGMSEETKKELVLRLVGWAKQGGKVRKLLAIAAIFVLLVYYHSIGKKTCMEWKEVYGK